MSEWQLKAPLTVNWTLNTSCNFACQHCYSRTETEPDLPADVICSALAKVARWGVLAVNFGGGEPLLRPELATISRAASQAGLRVSLNTNGYLMDRQMADALADAGVHKVGVSIDSHESQVHDHFRGIPGSFERAVAAVEHLQAAGIRTSLSTVICRINHQCARELLDFARKLGVEQINFHNFKCSGLGYANRDDLDLTPAEWRVFYREALALRDEEEGPAISFDDPIIASLGMKSESSLVKGSICGKLSLAVKSNGDITPCGFIPTVIGNVVNGDLAAIWQESAVLHALRNKKATGKCGGCDHFAECLGGCSARALAMTGDINSPDPHCWEE
jgi:GeoRSP system radical SAM/SPASM protein